MCLADFRMGPSVQPATPAEFRRRVDGILASIEGMDPVDPELLKPFLDERKSQFESDPPRGLRRPETTPLVAGWMCPNCHSAHAPDVHSGPEPPRGGSLRERLSA